MCSFVANDVTIVGSSLGRGLIHFLSHVKMDAIYQLFCVVHTYHPIALLILHEEKTGLTHFFIILLRTEHPFSIIYATNRMLLGLC